MQAQSSNTNLIQARQDFLLNIVDVVINTLKRLQRDQAYQYIDRRKTAVKMALDTAYLHPALNAAFIDGTIIYGNYCYVRSQFRDADTYLQQAIKLVAGTDNVEEPQHNDWRSKLYRLLGRMALSIGEISRALEHFEAGLKQLQGVDKVTESGLIVGCAICHENLGQGEQIIVERYEAALAIARQVADANHLMTTLYNFGGYLIDSGQFDRALDIMAECEATAQKVIDKLSVPPMLTNYGALLGQLGRHEEERDKYNLAIEIAREINRQEDIIYALTNLGALEVDEENFELAEAHFREALSEARKIDHLERISSLSRRLGTVEYLLGHVEEADQHHNHALQAAQALGHPRYIGGAKAEHGAFQLLQDLSGGEQLIQEALDMTTAPATLRYVVDSLLDWLKIAKDQRKEQAFDKLKRYCLEGSTRLGDESLLETVNDFDFT